MNLKLSPEQLLLLGGTLIALAGIVSALDTWDAALKPQFVAGVLLVLGTQIRGLYTSQPK